MELVYLRTHIRSAPLKAVLTLLKAPNLGKPTDFLPAFAMLGAMVWFVAVDFDFLEEREVFL